MARFTKVQIFLSFGHPVGAVKVGNACFFLLSCAQPQWRKAAEGRVTVSTQYANTRKMGAVVVSVGYFVRFS